MTDQPFIILGSIAALMAAIFFVAKYFRRWKRVHNALDQEAGIPKHNAKFKYKYKTVAGVRVWSVVKVPQNALNAIDDGIREMLRRYTEVRPDWTNARSLSHYRVLFVEPTAINEVNEPGSPAIHVKGIQSAGTVIGCNSDSACRPEVYIVLPHQEKQDWRFLDYLAHSADHEGEHKFEWFNCVAAFFWFAHAGDVHPHTDNFPKVIFECKPGGTVK